MARRRFTLLTLTVLLVSTVACTSTPETDGAPSCNDQSVREVVERFLGEMNEGDAVAAEALVAPSLRFGWFSVDPERLGAESKDRSTLGAFLSGRVEAQEQIELVDFEFTSYRAQDRTGHFSLGLTQHSTDYADATTVGKGAIDCDTGLIIVWSVGPRENS